MKKYYKIGLLLLLVSFTMTMKLKKVKVGNVALQVPEAFQELDEQTKAGEYSGKNAPIAVYQSPRDKSAIAIYHTADSIRAKTIQYQKEKGANLNFKRDLQMEYAFKKSSFSGKFKEINFIQDGITNINGKEFIFFEFEGVIEGTSKSGKPIETKLYNYMLYTYLKENIYSVSFICGGQLKSDYQESIRKVMKTVKIK